MKVLMLKDAKGSDNGYEVNTYIAGNEYDLNDKGLVEHFVKGGAAKLVDGTESAESAEAEAPKKGKKKPADLEDKSLDGSDYENKSA